MSSEAPPSNQREFFCGFCHGRILIPRDLPPTTAPCPHCGQTITSPPLEGSTLPLPAMGMPMPVVAPRQPVTAVPPAPVPAPVPTGPITSAAVIPPVVIERATIVAPAQIVSPAQPVATAEVAMPVKSVPLETVTVRPGMKLQSPHEAEGPPPVPPRRGYIESDASDPALAKKAKPKSSSLLIPILVMLALLVAAVAVYILLSRTDFSTSAVQLSPEEQQRQKEEAYLNEGWKAEAVALLDKFSNAETPEEKAKWVLNPEQELPEMRAFYSSRKVDDSNAPAVAYAEFPSPADRDRGMFQMVYEQPPQLNLREPFFPLQTLEVQNGLADPDDGSKEGMLLTATAQVSNFASDEIRVQALFKRTPQGLRLDWPTYVQSKYKTFHDFTELPFAGKSAVFRVLIQEDVPDRGRMVPGSRAYKIFDPGNPVYSIRVNVPVDSEMGRSLAPINWIGTQNPRKDWRTATVELAWSKEESPQLQMKHFICWEFLGLGGDPGK